MARSRGRGVSCRLSRDHDKCTFVAGRSAGSGQDAAILPAAKSALRDRIRIGLPARLAARPAERDAANIVFACKRGLMTKLSAEAYAIVEGRHSDPFHYLGLHKEGDKTVVRAFLPEASNVEAIGEHGEAAELQRIHDAGLFAGALPNGSGRYQLRARFGETVVDLDDPYRFPPVLSDFDLYLLGEGTHQRIYDKLGAHPMTLDGVPGIAFVVLGPNARRGDHYKFDIIGPDGRHLPLKSDPLAFAAEVRPNTASIVLDETKIPH